MAADKDIRFSVTAEDRFGGVFRSLKRDIAGSGDELGRLRGLARESATALTGGILGVGVVGGFAALGSAVRRFADDLDALNDTSDATGATVENISALLDVARRNGGDLDLVTSTLLKLQRTLAEAKPDNALGKVFQQLGLDAKELRATDPAEAVLAVAKALQGFEDGPEKAQYILALFGKQSREAAAYLKDLADNGSLVARATAEQAAQAERFNKQLFAMQTNISNVARSLVADLLPVLNGDFARLGALRDVFGGITSGAATLVREGKRFTDAGEGVAYYVNQLKVLQQQRDIIAADSNPVARRGGLLDVDAEIERAKKLEQYYRRVYALTAGDLGQSDPRELARRGRGGGLPTLPDVPDDGGKKTSEAQQYLERLQRQGEALQQLTVEQQLLRDIERGRIDGITPRMEQLLRQEAQRVDVLTAQERAIKAQQSALDDLIATRLKRADELDGLLGNTPTGKAKDIERRVDILLNFSRANASDEGVQRQVLEALQPLRKELESLDLPADKLEAQFGKLEVVVDKFAERTVDAFVELGTGAETGFARLRDAFKADLLREFIEDPVRDSMKKVVKTIKDAFSDGSIQDSLGQLGSWIQGVLGGGGGGFGDLFSGIGQLFGFTGRANGGPVGAGDLVRWQEHGREWALMGGDGTVVTQAQLQSAIAQAVSAKGGGSQFTVVVQGDASENTIALIQAAQAQFAARMGLQG